MMPSLSKHTASNTQRAQRGAALIVSLIMLLLLTVLGLSSMNTITMEERMAGNMNDYNLAFQAAEAGLRGGEGFIRPLTLEPEACDTAPCDIWKYGTLGDIGGMSYSWWAANGREFGTASSLDVGRIQDPFFIMEFHKFVKDDHTIGHSPATGRIFYDVTSSSIGGSNTTQSVLQSSFVKRFN